MEIYLKIFGLSVFENSDYSSENVRLLAFHIHCARPVLKITSNVLPPSENSPPDIARIWIFLCQVEPVLKVPRGVYLKKLSPTYENTLTRITSWYRVKNRNMKMQVGHS